MKALKRFGNALTSRAGAYIFYVLAMLAVVFLESATWAYTWIAELYPLGNQFVPTLRIVILVFAGLDVLYLLARAFSKTEELNKPLKVFRAVFVLSAVVSLVAFIYTFVLVFGLDNGVQATLFARGLQAITQYLIPLGFVCLLPLPLLFTTTPLKTAKAAVASALVAVLIVLPLQIDFGSGELTADELPALTMRSEDLLAGAAVSFESLKSGEEADAANLLDGDDKNYWTPQDPARDPAEGQEDGNNSYVELQLPRAVTFNTAIIEEEGNEAQYFRLQAFVDGEWVTVYQSEKIQAMRLCSFDAVTTDRVRLSVDKFRSSDTPVRIRALRLYNEPQRAAEDFEVTAYQRLDGDVPTEILARGEAYARNYARFYDVYSTVLVFAAVHWDEQGNMNFGDIGEEGFAREIAALRELIAMRSNPDHRVKIIVTALADGAWGDGHNGVNTYMAQYWESVADKIVAFVEKYDFDGVGEKDMYLLHHEEIESLAKNIRGVKRIRFFMTFGQSYLTHMKCLENVGMLSTQPIMFEGREIVPIQFLKALLPDPASLGPRTKGKTNIGCIFTGVKDGKKKSAYIYNICDHEECFKEVGSQAVAYTTGVPAMIGAMMMVTGKWTTPGVYTVEQFDPDPYMDALNKYGLPWQIENDPVLVD